MPAVERVTSEDVYELLGKEEPLETLDIGAVTIHVLFVDGKFMVVADNPADESNSAVVTIAA